MPWENDALTFFFATSVDSIVRFSIHMGNLAGGPFFVTDSTKKDIVLTLFQIVFVRSSLPM